MTKSISRDVRSYIAHRGSAFKKRDVAEQLWPRWKNAGLSATNDFRCFKTYVGSIVLDEKEAGRIEELYEIDGTTGAKRYQRVESISAKNSPSLATVPTALLVAELARTILSSRNTVGR